MERINFNKKVQVKFLTFLKFYTKSQEKPRRKFLKDETFANHTKA